MFDIHKGIVMILIVCIHSIYIAEKCTPGFQYPLFVRGLMKTSSCGLALLFLISGYSFRPSPWKKSFFSAGQKSSETLCLLRSRCGLSSVHKEYSERTSCFFHRYFFDCCRFSAGSFLQYDCRRNSDILHSGLMVSYRHV